MPTPPSDDKPLCFVIGPIGKAGTPERRHSDLLLNFVIREALTADGLGYRVKRADEDADPGMIADRVVLDIINASLVVADLTDLNANAFYELGIRHSTEKPTIHIAKSGTPLPFDNVTHRTIFVDLTDWNSIKEARESLRASALATRAPEYRVSNPITQANASFRMRESADPIERLIADVHERLARLEFKTYERGYLLDILNDRDARNMIIREVENLVANRSASGISPLQISDDIQHWCRARGLPVHRTVVGSNGDFDVVVDGRSYFRFNGRHWELPPLEAGFGPSPSLSS